MIKIAIIAVVLVAAAFFGYQQLNTPVDVVVTNPIQVGGVIAEPAASSASEPASAASAQ